MTRLRFPWTPARDLVVGGPNGSVGAGEPDYGIIPRIAGLALAPASPLASVLRSTRGLLAVSRSKPDGPPNAEPGAISLQAMLDAIDDAPYLRLEQDRWLTQRGRSLAAESRGSASATRQ